MPNSTHSNIYPIHVRVSGVLVFFTNIVVSVLVIVVRVCGKRRNRHKVCLLTGVAVEN